tara:strand:+ start:51 stop:506 length:456 start_codon:yes stop_codon:yes gene_type:complete
MVTRVTTKLNDGTQGLFVSKPGVDVLTTTSPWDLVFDSRLPHYGSIVASGTATRGSTVPFTALTYVPMVMAFIISGSTIIGTNYTQGPLVELPVGEENGSTGSGIYYIKNKIKDPIYSVSSSSITFLDPTSGSFNPPSYTAKYIIFRAPGT